MKGTTITAITVALAASASVALGQGTPSAPPVAAPGAARVSPSGAAPASGPAAASAAATSGRCALHGASAASMKAAACLACHGAGAFTHPVDRDYDDVRGRRPKEFRLRDEVTRHGIPVPEGQVRCVSCHDGRSPWAHYLLLPTGAEARAKLDPKHPGAEEGTDVPVAAKPGDEVASKPLCLACHSY